MKWIFFNKSNLTFFSWRAVTKEEWPHRVFYPFCHGGLVYVTSLEYGFKLLKASRMNHAELLKTPWRMEDNFITGLQSDLNKAFVHFKSNFSMVFLSILFQDIYVKWLQERLCNWLMDGGVIYGTTFCPIVHFWANSKGFIWMKWLKLKEIFWRIHYLDYVVYMKAIFWVQLKISWRPFHQNWCPIFFQGFAQICFK